MLKTLNTLLGDGAPALRRYLWLTLVYGALSGLTISALAPLMLHLLAGDNAGAVAWLAALASGTLLCWTCRRRVELAGIAVASAVLREGRLRLGEHVAQLPLGWFTPDNTARLSHVLTHGLMTVAQLPAHVFTPLIAGSVMPVVLALLLCLLHGALGLIALLALPLLVGVMLLSARLGSQADQRFQQHFAEASQRVVEFAQAQSVLRAFNGAGGATRRLDESLERQRRSGRGLILRSTLSALLNSWAVQATFAALLVTASVGFAGHDGLAVSVALVIACRFIDPLQDVASHVEILRGSHGQLKEIERILSAEPLPEPASPQPPVDATIDLQGVSLRYGSDSSDVLHDIDLHLPAGSMTAIIGASGSGKTSLLRLIARFFDASRGSVRIGGVDLQQMDRDSRVRTVSQVLQDTWLFQGSIADNIRIGRVDASAAEVLRAARLAGLDEVLERLPQGLDTQAGEGGARLSGGERQRVTIARALIKEAPVLLVDEATAALDANNEALIIETLASLRGRCTLVVVAHQLNTVAMADQIVVLEGGRVVEQGPPDVLRTRGGHYARFLAQRQAACGWRIASSVEHDGCA